MTEQMKKQIDDVFSLWSDGLCPGGQVFVKQNGETVYDRCFGYADIENQLPVTDESVFHIASVSKQLTVCAALLLREDGLLNIDDDIREYIPDLVRFDEPVTVRNLMNNDTGIRDIWTLEMARGVRIDDTITQKDAVDIISAQTQLNFEPESQYMYSNSNFVFISEIVERLSGRSLNDFLTERVFKPLGMTHTVIRDRYWQIIPNRARSFSDDGTHFYHSVLNYGSYGSTSLHTTAHDFMKWAENFKHPTICSQETIDIMTTVPVLKNNAPTTYAAGLMTGDIEGHKYFGHSGSDAAFRSYIMCLPDDDIQLVLFTNTQNTPTAPAAEAVVRILLGLEPKKQPEMNVIEDFDEDDAEGFYYSDLPTVAFADIIEIQGNMFVKDDFEYAPLTHIRGNLYKQGHLNTWYLLGSENPCVIRPNGVTKFKKADDSPVEEELLLRYEGRYESSEIETAYEIYEEDGMLFAHHFRNGDVRLHPVGYDRFMSELVEGSIFQFVRGSGGKVSGFTMSFDRVQNLPFSKID